MLSLLYSATSRDAKYCAYFVINCDKLMEKKLLKKAKFWAKILGYCPSVVAIFLSGSVAIGNAKKSSDIDFFIIARNGRIWTARFFVFLVLKLFRQLAKPENHAGKICPNHFITDDCLEIVEQDQYAANLFAHNITLSDFKNIFPVFAQTNQKWVTKFGESFSDYDLKRNPSFSLMTNKPSRLESFLRKIQIKKIQKNPDYQKQNAKIILENNELRFHPEPKNTL